MKRTFVDAGVLIAAARGQGSIAERALAILEDPGREFAASRFLQLEVLPKATYFTHIVDHWAEDANGLLQSALTIAIEVGLSAMDALHVAAAAALSCDELVTTEKPGNPLYRNRSVRVVFLAR